MNSKEKDIAAAIKLNRAFKYDVAGITTQKKGKRPSRQEELIDRVNSITATLKDMDTSTVENMRKTLHHIHRIKQEMVAIKNMIDETEMSLLKIAANNK